MSLHKLTRLFFLFNFTYLILALDLSIDGQHYFLAFLAKKNFLLYPNPMMI
ncbi:hypothetical protein HanXRQr2_Chr16g0723431 [Helianthus annuus]|uniref:Uncharacterized protein n=1 Tax=Helianthus annuus TaxID=4232 RepID=A0A9K3DPI9_HELAN|nr:hypothetical protein HanXRQr2_Chr16g0723431 [Helianthus annuus]KAJ0819247.1 hypothetical protein HanPSC8_Chr16g0693911 [Helianthus annuus]